MDAVLAALGHQAPGAALVSLIALAIGLVLRGTLVPRTQVRELVAVQEQRLAESRDREREWRSAWEVSEAARAVLAGNDADLLEAMRTLEALIRALPPPRRGDRT